MTSTQLVSLAPNITEAFIRTLVERADVPPERPAIGVVASFTEDVFASVPEANADDVAAAVDAARKAQVGWAATSVGSRIKVLSRFHDLLLKHSTQAMDLIQLEAGKARVPAFEEVFDAIATTRYYVKTAAGLLKRQRRAVSLPGFTTAYEYHHPHGVVGNITPWNFPFTLSISDIIAALIAGNAVVIKPDEQTPFSSLYGALLLSEAGLPDGVLQVVTGYGEKIGSALIDNVDFIAFTGSTEVGRIVAEQAGKRLIPSSMELGGKNAAIVMADADMDKTVRGISRAVYANGGQLCVAMERIYVDETVREQFTQRFVEHTNQLELTTEFDFCSALSSLISREHLDKVHSHVEDAVANGATLLTGGKPRPDVGPLFYAPTVLTDVDDGMLLCRDETFGPVVSIYGYDGIETAIYEANASHLGLNFSVWTGDATQGVDIASRLKAGTVGVNDGYAATWSSYDAPMGGMRASGMSRRHANVGLLKYTESQTVAVQRGVDAFAPLPGMDYPRYLKVLGPLLKVLKKAPFYK